ncbi:MAG TPA: hypothetical protein ENO07_02120 [candidate division Zixibacteria bacterium]|nr:hypothetical protein [candidate division Zixibacteria bacterium]
MFVWCAILFLLGIAAFLDSLFSYGDIFRKVNSVLFMLVSLGLLVRTTTKMRMRRLEGYLEKIDELEHRINELRAEKTKSATPR